MEDKEFKHKGSCVYGPSYTTKCQDIHGISVAISPMKAWCYGLFEVVECYADNMAQTYGSSEFNNNWQELININIKALMYKVHEFYVNLSNAQNSTTIF